MIKSGQIFLWLLLFWAIKMQPVFAQGFVFPRLTFPSLVVSNEKEPGPFYTATPATLLQRNIYTGTRYVYSDFQTFWGVDFETEKKHVDFVHQVFQLTLAYGITNRLLLGMTVPWKQVSYEEKTWGSNGTSPMSLPSGGFKDENEGIGDVVVTTRYKILRELEETVPFSWAAGVDIKFPTGDDRHIRGGGTGVGTGETDYKVLTMLSKRFGSGTVYCNLGYHWEGRSEKLDTLEYNVALVFPITKNSSISGEFLGVSFVNWEIETYGLPIDPVDSNDLNTYDAGLGVKFQTKGITVELGVTYPLNDDYTRTRLQPTIGINYVFR